jgi:hypothetical protein
MSDTKNVKIGVCKVLYNGVDLGYTQGGVEVTVKTETHKVMVDQFGKTPINEYIMGREVMVKCPLAETTLNNLVEIMPGATLYETGGVQATGTMTIATQPTDGQTVKINGATVTFKAANPNAANNEVLIGSSASATATNLAAAINATTSGALTAVTAAAASATVTLTSVMKGSLGNSIAIATGTAGASVTVSAATLTGGVDGTPARVDVQVGVGSNLLDIARPLILHPVSKADNDHSEDFTVFKAATAGALNFAYKLENERVFSCEFNGYPDPVTGKLFAIGDPAAA